jgi:alkylation response protein AidB-like acyl-CoA dehydrogenase
MDHPVVVAARGLAATLAAHTDDHVRARALAPAVIDALTAGDCWRLLVPRALGGLALTPADYVDVLTALAAGDAASAWVVMTASTSTLLAGYLPPATARGIWGAGAAPICAGVFAPGGRLTPEGDGLRLRGRWPYASGCQHASWALVGAQSGEPPRHVVCAVPMDAPGVTVVDTWDPIGLAGTGSHDLVIDTALPATAVTSVFDQAAWLDEPLARGAAVRVARAGHRRGRAGHRRPRARAGRRALRRGARGPGAAIAGAGQLRHAAGTPRRRDRRDPRDRAARTGRGRGPAPSTTICAARCARPPRTPPRPAPSSAGPRSTWWAAPRSAAARRSPARSPTSRCC